MKSKENFITNLPNMYVGKFLESYIDKKDKKQKLRVTYRIVRTRLVH